MLSILTCDVSRVEYQLPNLIVGAITKESLYNAFENGITADQVSIIKYKYLFLKYDPWFLQVNGNAMLFVGNKGSNIEMYS